MRGAGFAVEVHARNSSLVYGALGAGSIAASPFGTLRRYQATLQTLALQNVASSPLTLAWTLPTGPQFLGLQLHYQALIVDPLEGPRLGNAIGDAVR